MNMPDDLIEWCLCFAMFSVGLMGLLAAVALIVVVCLGGIHS